MAEQTVADLSTRYTRFAETEAHGRSLSYEVLARGVAGDRKVLGFLMTLPEGKRQPNIRMFMPERMSLVSIAPPGRYPGGGAFYRDVPPGHYHIAVASYGTDTGQSSDIDLPAGEEAYVQIQSLSAWATGGGDDVGDFKRDTFYARLVPAQLARAQIARSPFYGGS